MATGFRYKTSDVITDIAGLTAKNINESLTGVTYIKFKESDYKFTDQGNYFFIPYATSVLDELWASKPVVYKDSYKTGPDNDNTVKISNAAAWGSAPIPKRTGLSNTDSPYISTKDYLFDETKAYVLSWNNNKITLSDDTEITSAPCVIVDLVACGGAGGDGYMRMAYKAAGGGGGSGAQVSLFIDMSKAKEITFDKTSDSLLIKNSSGSTFIYLYNGKNGGDGSYSSVGEGGEGGDIVWVPNAVPNGVKLLWAEAGSAGGKGAGGNVCSGSSGESSPETITFLTDDAVQSFSGGTSTGYLTDTTTYYSWAGGGGGASIFAAGGNGGTKSPSGTATRGGAGNYGSGGGGGYILKADENNYGNQSVIYNRSSLGGDAFARFYFESTYTNAYSDSSDSSGSEGGGGSIPNPGCVFPGTQIFLDKDTCVDIADFKAGTPIDFCNPDTLEHFPQQTLVRFFSKHATRKITLWLEDGKTIALTPDHAVLAKEGFKTYLDNDMFPKYNVGEELATVDGYKKIISIQDEPIDATTVYNIATENSLMVANGIIVAGELNYNTDTMALDEDFEKTIK